MPAAANAGAGKFVFTAAPGAANVDTIMDFTAGSDTLRLKLTLFSALGETGALDPSMFTAAPPFTSAQPIIYDAASGSLFYDADGSGSGAQAQFAHLNGSPVLSASSFLVV